MRAYRLHDTSWNRIVTHRVRRPNVIVARMGSRRRREHAIPVDGQLVLLNGNQHMDPRTGTPVDRRELLDRIVEALSVTAVDGVVGSANLLEELTLLNVLEDRLAICASSGERPGLDVAGIVKGNYDAASLSSGGGIEAGLAATASALADSGVPALVDLVLPTADQRSEYDTDWSEWIEPLHAATGAVATGAGVWFTLPPILGMSSLAAQTGFPVLVRDTDVPIAASAWTSLFGQALPLNVRGVVAGASALFPIEGSVESATAQMAAAVRDRVS